MGSGDAQKVLTTWAATAMSDNTQWEVAMKPIQYAFIITIPSDNTQWEVAIGDPQEISALSHLGSDNTQWEVAIIENMRPIHLILLSDNTQWEVAISEYAVSDCREISVGQYPMGSGDEI